MWVNVGQHLLLQIAATRRTITGDVVMIQKLAVTLGMAILVAGGMHLSGIGTANATTLPGGISSGLPELIQSESEVKKCIAGVTVITIVIGTDHATGAGAQAIAITTMAGGTRLPGSYRPSSLHRHLATGHAAPTCAGA
jgi:hypothetical protein